MDNLYLVLSVIFITKWLFLMGLVALAGTFLWSERCTVLKHQWTWKRRPLICGKNHGTLHLITCDRCHAAHLTYKSWWEPDHNGQPAT